MTLHGVSQNGSPDSSKMDLTPFSVQKTEVDTYYVWTKRQANELLAFLEERNGYKMRYEESQAAYDSSMILVQKYEDMLVLKTNDSATFAKIIKETKGKFELCTSAKEDCQGELESMKGKLRWWRTGTMVFGGATILLTLILILLL